MNFRVLVRSRWLVRIFAVTISTAALIWGIQLSGSDLSETATRVRAPEASALPHEVENLALLMFPELYQSLSPVHQEFFRERVAFVHDPNRLTDDLPPAVCFSPGVSEEVMQSFNYGGDLLARYWQEPRWSTTAHGSTGGQGDPITITYSFPPDGTTTTGGGVNDLHAWLTGIYGNEATWQAIFATIFTRWQNLAGVTYVYEPNDDGVSQSSGNVGALGVRGDVRICARFIDGDGGGGGSVLAFNSYPNHGDMVLDSADPFYDDISDQSQGLKNVVWHEHGHGLGMEHVCPVSQTKLMEPFISFNFGGPQQDDIRNAHRHYGDFYEPDNSPGAATDLGDFGASGGVTLGNLPSNSPYPAVATASRLSIDANGEQDYFFFETTAPARINVQVIPVGNGPPGYADGAQTCGGSSGCCATNPSTISRSIADLSVELIASNGSTVLAGPTTAAIGLTDSINGFAMPVAGGRYVRVFESPDLAPGQTQMYTLSLTFLSYTPLTITLPQGPPASLDPGQPETFNVIVTPGNETLVANSATLHYRYDGGTFLTTPLVLISGNNYTATLPAPACEDNPEFYISAQGTNSGIVTNPAGGASSPYAATVTQDTCGGPPAPPTGVQATDGSFCDKVTITWNASEGATSYEVWRHTIDDPNSSTLLQDGIVNTTYDDATADPGATYYYWLTGCNLSGCSDSGAPDTGFVAAASAAPTGLSATLDTVCGAVDVAWTAAAGAPSYNVYRNTVDDFNTSVQVDDTANTTSSDVTGDPAVTYFYWVTSENTCGESAPAGSVTGSAAPKGDFNLDGTIDGADLPQLVEAHLGALQLLDCADLEAPFGTLDQDDLDAIIAILIGL
ncbi:MAG TPA: matrixin family metalloprotease [Phycisphaerae bacterium]|nr:matrixin family metalloprotease [Phycisphaerae bacterium]